MANFNLIRLGSVIPPRSQIVVSDRFPMAQGGTRGDRLYAVYAERRSSVPGAQIWAGVGWSHDRETGRGLIVDHEGAREDDVTEQITVSLRDLQATRGLELGPIQSRVVGAMCTGVPTCALVICGYVTEPWLNVDGSVDTAATAPSTTTETTAAVATTVAGAPALAVQPASARS